MSLFSFSVSTTKQQCFALSYLIPEDLPLHSLPSVLLHREVPGWEGGKQTDQYLSKDHKTALKCLYINFVHRTLDTNRTFGMKL